MLKKLLSLCLTAALCCSLSSCNILDFSDELLLSPPMPEGELYYIQTALYESAGEDITLKYPTAGDYRSAFILRDLDKDGTEEAIALYSSTADATVTMHINLMVKEADGWVSRGDASVVGSGVEKVVFGDLGGDAKDEIAIGWSIYGTVDRQVGIYSYDGKTLSQRAMESYTDFVSADMDGDNISELLVLSHNTAEKTSSAKVLSLSDEGIEQKGSAPLDGGVTSYSAPLLSYLSDGKPAVYIDAVKGAGTLTEILWFEGGILKSLYDSKAEATTLTYRASAVASRDFDGDGRVDIPILSVLLSTQDKEDFDKVYVTEWNSFDGKKLSKIASAFMNYSDGYYLTIPENRQDRFHLTRKTDSRLRIFYSYDPETRTQGSEVFRIMVISKADYDAGKANGYHVLKEQGGLYYVARVVYGNELGITSSEITNCFGIIE